MSVGALAEQREGTAESASAEASESALTADAPTSQHGTASSDDDLDHEQRENRDDSGFSPSVLLDDVVFARSEAQREIRRDLLHEQGEAPSQRLRVDRDSTESARDLSDLIQRTTEYGSARGESTAPSVEGLSGAYFNVLIDGLPATSRIQTRNGPTVDLSLIPVDPSNIERIDVYQGVGPAASGDGSGVVLDIITKSDLEPGVSAEFATTTGDEGLHSYDARGELRLRPAEHVLFRTDVHFIQDYPLDADDDGDDDSPEARTFGINTSLLWHRSEDERTRVVGSYSSRRTDRDNPAGPNNLVDRYQARIRAQNKSKLENEWKFETSATLGVLNDEFAKDAPNEERHELVSSSRIIDGLGTLLFEKAFGPVDLGFELCGSGLQVGQLEADATMRQHGEGQVCGAANLHWWASDKVDLTMRALGAYHTEFGPRSVAGTTLTYRPHDQWVLRTSVNWNERVPTSEERFQFFDHSQVGYIVQGNPDLNSEQTLSVRAKVGFATNEERFGFQVGGFAHFQRDRIDPILTETAGTSGYGAALYEYQNVGDARTAGVRAEARSHIANAGLDIVARYTWLPEVENLTTDEELELQSHHATRLLIDGSWLDDRLSAWTSLGARSPLTWNSGPEGAPPSEWQPIWNVGIAGKPVEALELRAEAQNILDETDPQWGPFAGWEIRTALRLNLPFKQNSDSEGDTP